MMSIISFINVLNYWRKKGGIMALELNEENLKEAYCKVLACTGIGAAVSNCDDLLPKKVLVVVPQELHDDYPAKLLACAIKICTDDPYGWTVKNEEPEIAEDTAFQSLYDDWLMGIVMS